MHGEAEVRIIYLQTNEVAGKKNCKKEGSELKEAVLETRMPITYFMAHLCPSNYQ